MLKHRIEILLKVALSTITPKPKIPNWTVYCVCIHIRCDWFEIGYIIYKEIRRVWRYQRGNQNPYIEEELTTQWPKEKVQKDKQRSTKHTYKSKDQVTQTTPGVNSGAPEG